VTRDVARVVVRNGTRWQALYEALDHCARRVPLYRGIEGPDPLLPPELAAKDALSRFPILTKQRLARAFPHGLVPEGLSLGEALRKKDVAFVGTSGTTGERVQVLWHQPWWDAQERDGFRVHPLTKELVASPGYREAVLTTPVCSGNLCHVGRLPMQERVEEGKVLFLNQAMHPASWSDADVIGIADELELFAPTALEADPAYLAHFCARLSMLGRKPYRPRFVDTSYEFAASSFSRVIAQTFEVPVLDAYGSTECGFVFFQCAAGRYHHNSEWSAIEIVPLPAARGLEGVGRLLVTPLRNPWLNLVRFDTGDLVRMLPGACECGQSDSVVLSAIEGRAKDLLVCADGGFVTVRAVDRVLSGFPSILHWRVCQTGPTQAHAELVALPGMAPALESCLGAVSAALARCLGFFVAIAIVPSLPVEVSGKFRLCAATHADVLELLRG